MDVLSEIKKIRLVPVVVLNRVEDTLPTVQALIDGQIPVAEITFRTPCAAACIAAACKAFPDALIGAGTVIDAKQCEAAIDAGAKFIVSPGLSEAVAATCKRRGIPYLPGVVTPTEIIAALDLGITTLKFFPAGAFGGLKTIKAMAAAFPGVQFMPTGGVDASNLAEFLSFDKIIAVGGSWMVKGTPEEITAKCLEAARIARGN